MLFSFACEAAGASCARHSLRPLISEGGTFTAKLARTRGEIAMLCRPTLRCLKIESDMRAKRSNLAPEWGQVAATVYATTQQPLVHSGCLRHRCPLLAVARRQREDFD